MTDITDRHTLRRMSWSELITAGQEAEFQHDYERARIVWSFALHVAKHKIKYIDAARQYDRPNCIR